MNIGKCYYFSVMLILVIFLCPIKPVSAIELSKEERAYLDEKGTIIFVSQTRYPPFEFVDKNGEHTGMCIELARWMATELGFTARFVDSSFQAAQEAILSGKADVLTSLFYSKKRDGLFDFTQVMFEVPASIFVVAERTDIKDLSDLNGKLIAMQSGDYAKEYLESKSISFEVVYTKDFAEATDLVIAGKADAVIGDEQIVLYHIFKNGLTKKIKRVGDPLYIGQNCMATKESRQVLISILDKGINQARKSGIFEKINRKWIGTRYTLRDSPLFTYLPHILVSLGGVFMLLLVVWFWNIRLRHVVSERTEELEKSEEQYRTLMDNLPVAVYRNTPGPEGQFLMANPAFCKMFGFKNEEEVKDVTPASLYQNPKGRKEYSDNLIQKGVIRNDKRTLLKRDGNPVHTSITSRVVYGKDGEVSHFDSIMLDITEQKLAEEALRESEEKYRNLVEESFDGIFIQRDKSIIFANKQLNEMLGYREGELIGQNHWVVYHPDYQKLTKERAQARLRGEEVPRRYEVKLLRKDGSWFYGEINARSITFPSDEERGIQVWIKDIMERKLVEETLQASEEKYRTILESIEDGYYETDLPGNFTFFNTSLCRIFGYSKDELMGMNNQQYTDKENAKKLYQAFNKVYTTGKPEKGFDWEIIKKDGTKRSIDASVSLRRDAEGELTGFRGIVRDISEKQKLEAQLQQAQKMEAIGTLAGGVAHDLNNILSGLVSYPELLLLQLPEDSPLRKPILTIQKSGEKAAAVVQDLLTLARRGVVVTEVVNLNDVIDEYLKSPEHEKLQSYYPGVHIETHLEKNALNILGSPIHLSKTVMNLVSNAAEAMPEGGRLTVSTENRYIDRPIRGYDNVNEGDYVVLTISDTGTGIAPDDMEKIFEPFYTKKKMGRSGTGLGMAVVWGTVKDHNGYIYVDSTEGKARPPRLSARHGGQGTTFTLYFPVTRKSIEERSEIFLKDYMGKGEAILIVDDVEEQRRIASEMLEALGYSVAMVSSGEEAVEYLRTNKVALLVLDMIMDPGMDGLDTYKKIIELHPGQKTVIASGFSETSRVKELQNLGAGAYIKKPFLLEKIGFAVKEELQNINS